MIVEDPPPRGPSFQHQGKGPARGDRPTPLQDEARGNQREGRAQPPGFHLLEMQAVPPGTGREPAGVVLPDEVDPVPRPPAVDEGGGAFRGIIGQKAFEIASIPVECSPVQLRADLLPEGGVGLGRRNRRGVPARPAGYNREGHDVQGRAHEL